jgi:hypothetical protein
MKGIITRAGYFACLMILLYAPYATGQVWMDAQQQPSLDGKKPPKQNFYEIQKSFNTFWKDKIEPGKGKIPKAKGYKQFKRWEWFWQQRVGKDGIFPRSSVIMEEWEKYLAEHPEAKLSRQRPQKNTKEISSGTDFISEGSSNGNWQFLGPYTSAGGYSGMGRINCVAFDPFNPYVIWAGSPGGGLWKSINGGNQWTTQTDNLPVLGVSGIAIHPTNPAIMYIATGDMDNSDTYSVGVLKSINGGATWFPTGLSYAVTDGVLIKALIIHPTNPDILLAATSNGIYRTTNAGTNWTLEQSGFFHDIKFKPGSPSTVYASSYGFSAQIYRSTNAGDTWTLESNFSGVYRIALAVTPANPSLVGALLSNNTNYAFAGFYRSLDSGDSYSPVYLPGINLLGNTPTGSDAGGQAWYDLCLAISPVNANDIHVGGVNTWRSVDGGSNWSINTMWYAGAGVQVVHADKHFMAYHPLTNELFQCNDGGLYKTADGVNWIDRSNGLRITQFYRVANAATNVNINIAGAQDNGTKLRNGFAYSDVIGGDGMECLIDYTNANIMYGSYQYGEIFKSTNGGASFTSISTTLPIGAWITPFVIDPVNPQILYAGYNEVYKTVNGGASWSPISPLLSGFPMENLAVAPTNTQYIYASNYLSLYKTTNGGTNWSLVTLPNNSQSVTSIEVSPSDPNIVWITYSGYSAGVKVFRTDNGGTTWTNISGSLPNLPVNTIEYDKSTATLYIGTDVGVFVRAYDMADWQVFDAGLPNVIVNDLEIHHTARRLRVATYGRGLWESDLYNGQLQTAAYCAPPVEIGCADDYINHFSFNTLVNNYSGCSGQPNGYNTYFPVSNLTTNVKQGASYVVTMQSGAKNAQGFGVWIDYNDDKDFDDADEFVYASPSYGTIVYSGIVTIPANASSGLRRMRVRSNSSNTFKAYMSCENYTWGETEDYTISVGYCVPGYSSLCTSGDFIKNFSFNTLVNNNSNCNNQFFNYINYAPSGTKTTVLQKGQRYPISMQSGSFHQGFGVWIDYNDDKDFDDADEFVYSSPSFGTGVFSGTVTIPANVSTGQRRLRVRTKYNDIFTGSQVCENYTWGETEDYTVTITNAVLATSQWNKRLGGSGSDNFSVVIKTSDGGYLLGGHSTSGISGDKTQASQGAQDYWIVKTDASGNKQWDKRFGGSGGDYLNAMIRTSDGGYLLGGNSLSGISGDKSQASQGGQDYWIVKISSTGSKQWDKRFGGSGNDDLRTLHQLSTGEYILTGYSQSGISGDKSQASQGLTDYWVIKINSTGGKVWDKRFGGSGEDFVEASVVNSDGSIVLAGRSASGVSGDKSQASQGGRDFWVVKINSSGTKVWDKRFGGTGNEDAYGMAAVSDGYLIGGLSTSGISGDKTQASQGGSDFWVIKINLSGTKLWDKRFGGSLTDELRSLVATTDGGFLLGGKSDSGISGDKTQGSQGGSDYWAVKINSSGTKQWDKRFGGSAAEELRTVLQTSDNGYLLAGRSDSGISGDRTQASQGGTDYWMVKVSSSGGASLVAAARMESEQIEEEQQREETRLDLKADPNPFSEKITIGFTLSKTEQVRLKVYNSQGLEVSTLFEGEAEKDKTYEFEWKAINQTPGMYIIRLGSESKVETRKVILIR